jgi:hypothetical protein
MVWGKRTHLRGKSNQSVVMQLGNGQYIITLPKNVASWKGIQKGSLLKWSDAGQGRIMLEVVSPLKSSEEP